MGCVSILQESDEKIQPHKSSSVHFLAMKAKQYKEQNRRRVINRLTISLRVCSSTAYRIEFFTQKRLVMFSFMVFTRASIML